MPAPLFVPRPLTGSPLQFSLLLPFLLLVIGVWVAMPVCTSSRHGVSLPFAPHAPFISYTDSELSISVQSDRMIFIDAKWYPAPEFATRMLEFGTRSPQKRILLRIDRNLPFSAVRSVLLALRKAGFSRVSLITFEGPPVALIRHSAT